MQATVTIQFKHSLLCLFRNLVISIQRLLFKIIRQQHNDLLLSPLFLQGKVPHSVEGEQRNLHTFSAVGKIQSDYTSP